MFWSDFKRMLGIVIGGDDMSARLYEQFHDCSSDAASCARDKSAFSLNACQLHQAVPFFSSNVRRDRISGAIV